MVGESQCRAKCPRALSKVCRSRRWRRGSYGSCPTARLAVRAEVGRLPRGAREPRRRTPGSGPGTPGHCCATSRSSGPLGERLPPSICARRGDRDRMRRRHSTSTRCRRGCTRPKAGSVDSPPRSRRGFIVFDVLVWNGEAPDVAPALRAPGPARGRGEHATSHSLRRPADRATAERLARFPRGDWPRRRDRQAGWISPTVPGRATRS